MAILLNLVKKMVDTVTSASLHVHQVRVLPQTAHAPSRALPNPV